MRIQYVTYIIPCPEMLPEADAETQGTSTFPRYCLTLRTKTAKHATYFAPMHSSTLAEASRRANVDLWRYILEHDPELFAEAARQDLVPAFTNPVPRPLTLTGGPTRVTLSGCQPGASRRKKPRKRR